MVNLDLADAIAACCCQHWDKTVQLTIETHFAEDFGAITLHATVVVV